MGLSAPYYLIGKTEKYPIAAVNGRFQPFHKGHLEYILTAKSHCDFLCVGITQYDISHLIRSPLDAHREEPKNNPLTYFERVEMVTEILLGNGFKFSDFCITPFPIDEVGDTQNYLPRDIPIFTTICDKWNFDKIRALEGQGYKVKVLFERAEKKYSGMTIRRLILSGDEKWKEMVPPEAVRVIEATNMKDRLNGFNYG